MKTLMLIVVVPMLNFPCSAQTERPYDPSKGFGNAYLQGATFGRSHPRFDPTGERIVFASLQHESSEIYVMNRDGAGLTRLTSTPYWERSPRFVPGGRILFYSDQDDRSGEPYVMNVDGSHVRLLVKDLDVATDKVAFGPPVAFSPDGERLAVIVKSGEIHEVFIAGSDGSTPARLTETGRQCFGPLFTPGGDRVVVGASWIDRTLVPPRCVDLYSIRVDGTDLVRITDDRKTKRAFAIASEPPRLLMLRAGSSYNKEIWSVGLHGGEATRLTPSGKGASDPVLSPDGRTIFYVSRVGSGPGGFSYDVFSVQVDRQEPPTRITTEEGYLSNLSLSPDGRELLFLLQPPGAPDRGKGSICTFPVAGDQVHKVGENF